MRNLFKAHKFRVYVLLLTTFFLLSMMTESVSPQSGNNPHTQNALAVVPPVAIAVPLPTVTFYVFLFSV